MAELEPGAIDGEPTPEPPLNPSDIARKVRDDAEDQPLHKKPKAAARELYREVSGAYEAKQERDLSKDKDRKKP